jgi:hypothetical protein
MKNILNILKRSAYMEFPEFDLRVAPRRCVIYGEPDNPEKFRVEERPNPDKIPQGPHFKHRRFWFWRKRAGWSWGNKLKGCIHIDELSEELENEVCRFSQRSSLKETTRMACYYNPAIGSVVVDLDTWEDFLQGKTKSRANRKHRAGCVVFPTPEHSEDQRSEAVLNRLMADLTPYEPETHQESFEDWSIRYAQWCEDFKKENL